ncbi:hypothetical protein BT96DRAFT_345605 [Gymnopus androsaceus JB14]|uniref:Uncharacterized protein n=1 Tax=Gymnopus androsaceus JB14 TaxID=1447944 RepID=A0A6A4GZ62_9AGAR|nr:hypothetical protein BT96DRAFT_345605 [Gymnopus androsaceus JB14]
MKRQSRGSESKAHRPQLHQVRIRLASPNWKGSVPRSSSFIRHITLVLFTVADGLGGASKKNLFKIKQKHIPSLLLEM